MGTVIERYSVVNKIYTVFERRGEARGALLVTVLGSQKGSPHFSAGGNQGCASRHAGQGVTVTVRTASPHFRQRYGPSPSIARSLMARAGCENP